MPHLLDLPDEIILHILSACAEERDARHRMSFSSSGRQTILNFAKSSHRAFSLAEPFLYNTITLRKGIEFSPAFKSFKQRLLDQPGRNEHVSDVALVPAEGPTDPDFWTWASFVAMLPKLEHLFVEVPFTQADAIDDEETGEYVSPFWTAFKNTFSSKQSGTVPHTKVPAWASHLTTCHLNFNAPNGFCVPLGDIANVLAAPSIRKLTLVAADLREFELDRKTIRLRSSPLQHLRLESCIVSESSLRHMLSIPQALTTFFESSGTNNQDNHLSLDRLYGLSQALAMHRSTLKTLYVNPRDLRSLSEFESSGSRTITFAHLTSLVNLTIDFRDWRFEPGPTYFLERFPTSLRHLHLKVDLSYYSNPIPAYFAFWTNRIRRRMYRSRHSRPTFPRLETFAVEMMHITPSTVNSSQRDDLETAVWRLKHDFNVRVRIYRCTKQRNAVPPYLWDEYEPELVCMLDSNVMEARNLWNTQTLSEIKELERLEREWRTSRMIELDQQRLEGKRQRMLAQVERWEMDEMPCEADLNEASRVMLMERDRKARAALDLWEGLPLVPPEGEDGWSFVPASSLVLTHAKQDCGKADENENDGVAGPSNQSKDTVVNEESMEAAGPSLPSECLSSEKSAPVDQVGTPKGQEQNHPSTGVSVDDTSADDHPCPSVVEISDQPATNLTPSANPSSSPFTLSAEAACPKEQGQGINEAGLAPPENKQSPSPEFTPTYEDSFSVAADSSPSKEKETPPTTAKGKDVAETDCKREKQEGKLPVKDNKDKDVTPSQEVDLAVAVAVALDPGPSLKQAPPSVSPAPAVAGADAGAVIVS
ncbi:uncharacterized protein HMPREF1541_07701 [Cyphellophora europaea CBS 101466]|uniref:Uncharacterized protein n=1 Tax=Cyphellophora europaea (strain CBS 101466) TaxID=1220924 RepID=W2RNN1_CYPE1|nr:uncharacterized protein HMPREF1541_07701 [Cyphellophora europaea CBS 101466]ETN38077.1 hypothetical protein HMPREF1541_07701 [Cyphellophora europaea CBS 101466]